VLGMTFWTASMFFHKPLEFKGRTLTMSIIGLVSAAFNIVANIILIPIMGYVGAAVATILSFFLYMIVTMILIRKIQRIPYEFAAYAKVSLPVMVLLAGAYFLRRAWDPALGWTSFFVFLPLSLGVFAWIVFRLFKEKSSDKRAAKIA
jgi:O-antigen/teichoic acid export membrane protein